MKQNQFKHAKIGTVSNATLRSEDLLNAYSEKLSELFEINSGFFSLPENFAFRNRICDLLTDTEACFAENQETGELELIEEKEQSGEVSEIIQELADTLQEFALPYCYFGSTEGDGACFGFWPDMENAKENVEFISSPLKEYPPADFEGEWLHVNERGNCTLYVRDGIGNDSEIWGIV